MTTPNRVAALGGSLGAIVAALLAVLGAVDSYPKAIVLAVAILVIGILVVVFLLGSQRSEALEVRKVEEAKNRELHASIAVANLTQNPKDIS